MLSYASYAENPSSFILTFLVSIIITLFAYCAFPLIFAKIRIAPISAKKYTFFCYGFNLLVLIFFLVINGKSSGAPYILWTLFFSKLGTAILEDRHVLEERLEDNPNRIVKCKTCGYQSDEYFEACPKCGKYAKEVIIIGSSETTVVQSDQVVTVPHQPRAEKSSINYSLSPLDEPRSSSGTPLIDLSLDIAPVGGVQRSDGNYEMPVASIPNARPVASKKPPSEEYSATISDHPKSSSAKGSSNTGFWVLIILLMVGLGISLYFNYSQHNELVAKQELIDELLHIEETEANYQKLLSAMQNVHQSTYKNVGKLLDQFSVNYLGTSTIRYEYFELAKYFRTLENWSTSPTPHDVLRTTYEDLYNFNRQHANWDLSDYLQDDFFDRYFEALLKSKEWSDGEYYFTWSVEDAEYLSTDLPTNQKSWLNYDYIVNGNGRGIIIESENKKDTTDVFYTYKIVDVYYSGGKWNLKIYCYADDTTYTLH